MGTELKIVVAYVYSPVEARYEAAAERFVWTYSASPGLMPHRLKVIVNGRMINDSRVERKFVELKPCPEFFQHDDIGWDIGGFIALAQNLTPDECDMLVCFGGHSHLKRAGWLRRLAEAWELGGPGMYGTLGTYEIRPHLNTTGFAVAPEMLRRYPVLVKTKEDRYAFEHGTYSFHRMVASWGYPVKLVTWDGIYPVNEWRKPENVYRRGDQSNCVTFFNHTDNFAVADPVTRLRMSELADTVTDKSPGTQREVEGYTAPQYSPLRIGVPNEADVAAWNASRRGVTSGRSAQI